MRDIRQVYVFVKTPTTMDKLKPGDIFSMDPAGEEDKEFCHSNELFLVCTGVNGIPKPQEGKPEGYWELEGNRLYIEENSKGVES